MTLRLKHVAVISKGRTTAALANNDQRGIPLINMAALRSTSCTDWVEGVKVDCEQGEIVVCWDGSNSGEFFRSQHSGALASTIGLIKSSNRVDKSFLFYLLSSQEAHLRDSIVGMGIPHVNPTELKNIRIPQIDIATQRQIADFLDRETARIDLLIEKKQRLVELLGERLTEALEAAVLGGASVQRGSDGEWLSDLAQGWRFIPLKHFVSSQGGATPSKDRDDFWIGDIPWVSPKDMKIDVIEDVPDHVSEAAVKGSALSLIPKGAVLIVVRGMILARYVPVCRLGCEGTINQDMKALISDKRVVSSEYLQLMLQGFSSVLMTFVEEAAHGTKKLRSDQLFNMKFPVPPLDVQAGIIRNYRAMRDNNKSVQEKTNASIDRLKEYRSALITAAVTGQIDVQTYAKSGTPDRRLDAIQEEMGA